MRQSGLTFHHGKDDDAGIDHPSGVVAMSSSSPATAEISLDIEGMSCASCVMRVEKASRRCPA
jgi:hypothetical protein